MKSSASCSATSDRMNTSWIAIRCSVRMTSGRRYWSSPGGMGTPSWAMALSSASQSIPWVCSSQPKVTSAAKNAGTP